LTALFDESKAIWRKSRRSNGSGGNCVEFAMVDGRIGIRDSKDVSGPILVFTAAEWVTFIAGTKAGDFDL
jgi:hypothetical protein